MAGTWFSLGTRPALGCSVPILANFLPREASLLELFFSQLMKRQKRPSYQQLGGHEIISKTSAPVSLVIPIPFSLLIELVLALELIEIAHSRFSPSAFDGSPEGLIDGCLNK